MACRKSSARTSNPGAKARDISRARRRPMPSKLAVLTDFDGTITRTDVAEAILEEFAPASWWDIEELHRARKIGTRESMARQFALLHAKQADLIRFVDDHVEMDDTCRGFAAFCQRRKIPLEIVSEGLDFYVRHLMRRWELRLPLRTNPSIEILGRRRSFGGTAGNLSRAAACLGVKTSLASFVGEDFPSDYRKALRKDGVDLTDLRPIRGATTPTAWIFSDSAGNQMAVIDQGPMKEGLRLPILRHSVVDVELVHLGTGRPQYYMRIARLAAERDRTIAFDPSQEIHYVYTPRLFRTLLRHTAYFFGNEAEIIQAKRFLRVTSTEGLLRFASVVIVTLGSLGSVLHARDGKIRIPRVPPTRVADVTGAGDAYRAGFYAGLSRGFDLRHCGILGSSVASFVVEAEGTQTHLPTWTQAVQRARKYAPF